MPQEEKKKERKSKRFSKGLFQNQFLRNKNIHSWQYIKYCYKNETLQMINFNF